MSFFPPPVPGVLTGKSSVTFPVSVVALNPKNARLI